MKSKKKKRLKTPHRLSITIDPRLWESMQTYKDELNFSWIAREAIRNEIKKLELWDDPNKEIAAVIERFLEEKEELKNEWQEKGFVAGQDWVKKARLTDVEYYVELGKGPDGYYPDEEAEADFMETYPMEMRTETTERAFWQGFLMGAESLWKEIKKHLR